MGRVVGIDLGTTNSAVAIVENGRPKVIPSPQGEPVLPSMIAYDNKGHRLVGQAAKRQMVINPKDTVLGAKRLMGRHYSSNIVKKAKLKYMYDIVEGPRNEAAIKVADRVFDLTDVSALLLEELKEIAQDYLEEEVDRAVITVPAYFNEKQRESVRRAGEKAGLQVLRIINEPTAAALAYGWGKKLNEKILVYDLGGGTFDVSILELYEDVYEVIAIGGDSFLGGMDFDQRIAEHLVLEFKKQTGIDLSNDPIAMQRRRDAAERAKKDLSSLPETRITLPFIAVDENGKPLNFEMVLTREKMEKLTMDLVKRTLKIVKQTLDEVNLSPKDIDEIILVGGQTRMPIISRAIQEFFGKPPRKGVHPDEVVALGAAILADALERGETPMVFVDVLPVSIGIGLAKGKFKKLIKKNTRVPTEVKQIFKTVKDNQPAVKVKIYQGESDRVEENEFIGEFIFPNIRKAKAGEVKIEITFKLDEESILHVSARDIDTGQEVQAVFKTDGVVRKETYRTDKILKKKITAVKEEQTGGSPSGTGEATPQKPSAPATSEEKKPEEKKEEGLFPPEDVAQPQQSPSTPPKEKEPDKPKEKKGFWKKLFSIFKK